MAVYYNPTEICQPNHIIAMWYLDEESGNSVSDATGHGHNGTASWYDGSSGTYSWVSAKLNNGWYANTNYFNMIEIPASAELAPSSFTVSAWLKPVFFGPNAGMIYSNYISGSAYNVAFMLDTWTSPYNKLALCSWYGGSHEVTSSDSLTANVWNHVVVTYNAETAKVTFYINGTSDSGGPQTLENVYLKDYANNYIGTPAGNVAGTVAGTFDEVFFWNVVLTSSEVLDLYSNNNPQRESPYVPRQSGACGHPLIF